MRSIRLSLAQQCALQNSLTSAPDSLGVRSDAEHGLKFMDGCSSDEVWECWSDRSFQPWGFVRADYVMHPEGATTLRALHDELSKLGRC